MIGRREIGDYGFAIGTIVITAFIAIMFVIQVLAVGDDSCAMLRLQTVGKTTSLLLGNMLKDAAFVSVKQGEPIEIAESETRKHSLLEQVEKLHDVHRGQLVFRVMTHDGSIICDTLRYNTHPQNRPLSKLTDADLLAKIIDACESSIDGRMVDDRMLFASYLKSGGVRGYILLVEFIDV